MNSQQQPSTSESNNAFNLPLASFDEIPQLPIAEIHIQRMENEIEHVFDEDFGSLPTTPTTPDRTTRNQRRLEEVQRTPIRAPPALRLEPPLIEPIMRRELSVQIHLRSQETFIHEFEEIMENIDNSMQDIDNFRHPA